MKLPRRRGFTLVELMIVVAIMGILAIIAIPKFGDLIRKSHEGAIKAQLGTLRSAISIYYGDMEGHYPLTLSGLAINGKYVAAIPSVIPPYYFHLFNSVPAAECDMNTPNASRDCGGWFYVPSTDDIIISCGCAGGPPAGPALAAGTLFVDCTHTDSKETVWTSY